MDSSADFDIGESSGLNSQAFIGGTFSAAIAVTSGTNAGGSFYPLPPGWGKQTLPHWQGELYPVDTSHYRNFTVKLRDSGGTGTQPVGMVFYRDGDSTSDGSYGHSFFKYIPQQGQWSIVSWDLLTETYGTPYHFWTTYPLVHGIRFDFANDPNAGTLGPNVQVAWIRVTTPQLYNVTWSDSPVGSYFVTAIDSDGTRLQFNATAVSGTSYAADLALLAPGDYYIEIKNTGNNITATSGNLHINAPPQIQIRAPTIRGDQTHSYAITANGHQWGPLSASDFYQINYFVSYNFTAFPGSFDGRNANDDPQMWLNTLTATIDTELYRSVCATLQVFGPRDVGNGSIGRFFWGVSTGSMSGTEGFVLYNSTVPNEYCFGDLKQIPLDPLSPPAPWAGTQKYFRFDPDEFIPPNECNTPDTCHDVRLDSVTLSPFALANPGYAFKWTLTDPDNASDTVDVYLDPDTTPLNGNEIHLGSTTVASGNGQFAWTGSCANTLTYGPWHVLMVASDSINPVSQYAGGPLLVGRYDGIFRNGFESIPATCP